jgi:2-iminobutanoate/2-iminopropanoate deaminase
MTPMPSWTRVTTPDLPEFPAFAHAAVAGDQIYVAGMLGLGDDFSSVVPGGIAAETIQSFRHVERILAVCDATLADIVKVTAYLTDLSAWDEMNRAYLEVFGPQTPARIAVGCDDLLFGAAVEFDCIAYRPR